MSIALKGFTFGIDFEGGTKVGMPVAGQNGTATTQQVEDVFFSKTLGRAPESVVLVGNGSSATVQIRSEALTNQQTDQLREALFERSSRRPEMVSPTSRRSATRRSRRPGGVTRSPRRR